MPPDLVSPCCLLAFRFFLIRITSCLSCFAAPLAWGISTLHNACQARTLSLTFARHTLCGLLFDCLCTPCTLSGAFRCLLSFALLLLCLCGSVCSFLPDPAESDRHSCPTPPPRKAPASHLTMSSSRAIAIALEAKG